VTKRILFVDDETSVLQGLKRMLRPMRHEWDMEFVDSGAKALERMAQAPFDVVVSDMMMPGMNGAELLAEVMKRHPQTVRLILSGHADKNLILKCVGSTHQYLAKPCDPDTLKATLLRAASLENSLHSQRLKQLVLQMNSLSSIPSLYSEIVDALHDPDVALEDVGAIIATDMAMSAKILKLVNSAFFGLRRQISSVPEAVTFIGLDTIKSLVLSINAFAQFDKVTFKKFSPEALWSHSLDTASAAKEIAQIEHTDRKIVDEAFISGLLHDTGKLVLAANYPDQYCQALELAQADHLELHTAEEHVFGADHAGVSGYLLGLWGLSVPVVEAIALHHCPETTTNQAFSPLTAVHAANALVQERGSAEGVATTILVNADYLPQLGLANRLSAWRGLICKPQLRNIAL
jgi:HD-like signal output (HDOD) protein